MFKKLLYIATISTLAAYVIVTPLYKVTNPLGTTTSPTVSSNATGSVGTLKPVEK